MTDKQPDALRLADELEEPLHDFPEPTTLEAEAASELRRLHAENETLTLYKSLADEYGLSIFKDLKDLTTEIENLRAKLKTYEDLGDAGSDAQLLRMGYAAARLEIESLRKEHADELAVAYMCGASREKEIAAQPSYEHQRAIMEGERNASLDAYSRVVSITSAESRLYERAFTSGWDRRDRLASYGQAPAKAAPESFLEIPDVQDESGINSHYSRELVLECINSALASHGQAPAQAAPAAVEGPIGYGPKVTVRRSCSDCKACNSESYAVQGDSGHYVYCEHPSLPESKYIGDTNWNTPHWCPVSAPTTQPSPQPSPAAQGDALDTMRLDWLDADESRCVFHLGKSWYTRPSYGLPYRKRASLREAIDAARAAQGDTP